MTASSSISSSNGRERSSPVVLLIVVGVVAAVFLIGFFSQDDGADSVGGFADPTGTGLEGLLGYRLLIEETGGSVVLDSGLPGESIDVAILATNSAIPFLATEGEDFVESWVPMLEWIEAGGTLITSIDVATGPALRVQSIDEDEFVQRGVCTIDALTGVDEIRTLEYSPAIATGNDTSCFGDEDGGFVVVSNRGEGEIVRLASMAALMNRSLDDASNGAFAARLSRLEDAPTVAFLPEPPIFFEPAEGVTPNNVGDTATNGDQVRRDGQGNPIEFTGGELTPLDDEGNPVGAGMQTLWQLIETRVKVLFAGLFIAGLIYVLAVSRRIGSPVQEPLPIELPSSSYVEAVGRLYARTPDSRIRSSQILRNDLRVDLARRVGMSADATASDLATAVSGGSGRDALLRALDGPPPATDEEFVALSKELIEIRERVDRGGVATLARPNDISFTDERASSG